MFARGLDAEELPAAELGWGWRDQSLQADKEVTDKIQELVWMGTRLHCPFWENWKSLNVDAIGDKVNVGSQWGQ